MASSRPGGRTAQVRAAVLEATADLLVAGGLEGVDLTEVARRSGVSKSTVYRRWGTVSALVTDVLADMAGSMGVGVGEAFLTAARAAIARKAPFVIFTAAGGARMQEGTLSLMQMPRTTVAIAELHEAGLPYIVVLTDPTTGGVTASYAMLGDIQIAEPGALIGFAGQRVIENTIREKLPDGFQRAEYLLEHGMLDMVVPRSRLRETLVRLIGLIMLARPPERAAIPAVR